MGEERTIRILHRDILLISALVLCAVGLFLFTRTVAAKERQLNRRVAAIWYQEGQRQLSSGAVEQAVESYRNATANDDNRTYVLALAEALAMSNHHAEAEQALLHLRESKPEDVEINLHLARLEAKGGMLVKRCAITTTHSMVHWPEIKSMTSVDKFGLS